MNPSIIDEIHGLKDSIDCLREGVDELYLVLDHLWRNREEIHRLLDTPAVPQKSSQRVAESLSCAECDATADSLSDALQNGWTRLQADLSGLSWNYLGICPSCSGPSATSTPSADPGDRRKAEGKPF